MHSIHFNALGNIAAALFYFSLPLIIVVAGGIQARGGADRARWRLARRFWYLPVLLPLALYYGIVYRWLFFDQFYSVTIADDGTWQLEYFLPRQVKTLSANQISEIQSFTGDLWTYRMVRILIATTDGRRLMSAQVSRADERLYLNLLNQHGEIE